MQEMRTVYAMEPNQMDDWNNICKAFAKKYNAELKSSRLFGQILKIIIKRAYAVRYTQSMGLKIHGLSRRRDMMNIKLPPKKSNSF